jgi:hypothetical protein
MEPSEIRLLGVNPERERVGAIDVAFNDRRPGIRQVPGQLELHARVIDRNRRRQDQRVLVALLPEAVNDGGHETQHTARALELHQRGPVGIQPVEHLGMNWIRGLHPLLVVSAATFRRELRRLRVVQLGKAPRRQIPVLELIPGNRLEQSPTDDLEPLFGRGWSPS